MIVLRGTSPCLTSEFGMGSGEPRHYDRPIQENTGLFINVIGWVENIFCGGETPENAREAF